MIRSLRKGDYFQYEGHIFLLMYNLTRVIHLPVVCSTRKNCRYVAVHEFMYVVFNIQIAIGRESPL